LRLVVLILFSTIVVRCLQAQLPIAASDLSRWLDYQEKLNQSRDEMDSRSRTASPGIPGEATISVGGCATRRQAKRSKRFNVD